MSGRQSKRLRRFAYADTGGREEVRRNPRTGETVVISCSARTEELKRAWSFMTRTEKRWVAKQEAKLMTERGPKK